MTSWRDSASDQCQTDLDGLLNHIIGRAQAHLAERGEFAPFGASVTIDGQMQMLGVGEFMPSAEMLLVLADGATAQRASIRAVAFGSDVRLQDGVDAIRCDLEHQEGVAIAVVLPYQKKRFGRGIDYGELKAAEAVSRIWQVPPALQ